jgi:hypothetical protein
MRGSRISLDSGFTKEPNSYVFYFGDDNQYELRFEKLLDFGGPLRAYVALYENEELLTDKVPVHIDIEGGDDQKEVL